MGIALPPQEGLRGVLRAYPSFPGVFVGKGGVRPENDPLSKKISRLQNENFGKNRHKIH
jgi:hypothetical protein